MEESNDLPLLLNNLQSLKMYLKILTNKQTGISTERKIRQFFEYTFLSLYKYIAFRKRFRLNTRHGFVAERKLSDSQRKEYRQYWGRFSKYIETNSVTISYNQSGIFDVRIIPEDIFTVDIEPSLNNRREAVFLTNKSLYNKWFGQSIFPKDYFHKLDGQYYDCNLEIIENLNSFIEEIDFKFPVVLKPNCDSSGGRNIYFLNTRQDIYNLIGKFSHLVVQEKIVQNDFLASINNSSINSVRVCIYKTFLDDSYHILNTSLRMGKDGSLDNTKAGGIVCSLNDEGDFNDYAVDLYGVKYYIHPNSGFHFKGNQLPNYIEMVEQAILISKKIINVRLISLDMCLDQNNKWRCIEVNLRSQTIRFAQAAGKPFFGDFTDEIIEYSINNHWALK
jgi:hypothetical protein